MIRLPSITLLVGAALLAAPALTQAQETHDPCIVAKIAIDVGSGASKMRSGIVNVCEQTVLFQVAKGKKAIEFKKNLRDSGEKKQFDSEFLKAAATDIKAIYAEVREKTISELENNPKYSEYAYLAHAPMEVKGVCTQAFREALNASEFFELMNSRENGQSAVPIRRLSQVEEGRLGYMGAISALADEPNADPSNAVSWDIGGASLQIVAYAGLIEQPENPWLEYGNTLASVPMSDFVVSTFLKKDPKTTKSWNPVLNKNTKDGPAQMKKLLEAAQVFVKDQMSGLLSAGWLSKKLVASKPASVYGIGGVHGGVISMMHKVPGYEDAKGYTQDDLKKLLSGVLFATDEELSDKAKWAVDKGFETGSATNVVLVYSVMKALGIKYVRVLDVDNSLGTMVSPSFWKPFGYAVKTELQKRNHTLVDPAE